MYFLVNIYTRGCYWNNMIQSLFTIRTFSCKSSKCMFPSFQLLSTQVTLRRIVGHRDINVPCRSKSVFQTQACSKVAHSLQLQHSFNDAFIAQTKSFYVIQIKTDRYMSNSLIRNLNFIKWDSVPSLCMCVHNKNFFSVQIGQRRHSKTVSPQPCLVCKFKNITQRVINLVIQPSRSSSVMQIRTKRCSCDMCSTFGKSILMQRLFSSKKYTAKDMKAWEMMVQFDKLTPQEKRIHQRHITAMRTGKQMYTDPATGYSVLTRLAHLQRGECCGNACRHCPFGHISVPEYQRKNKRYNSAFYV